MVNAPVRSLYHYELAIRLAKMFHLAQEFYHYNPARLPSPAEWVTIRRIRVKDAVNMVFWFGKSERPKADNRKVLKPYGESMKALLNRGYAVPRGGNRRRPSGHSISEGFSVEPRLDPVQPPPPAGQHRVQLPVPAGLPRPGHQAPSRPLPRRPGAILWIS